MARGGESNYIGSRQVAALHEQRMTDPTGNGPRLSIVVPNYNHAPLLEGALHAIEMQTMRPSEVIVVDDGSTDESVALIQRLAATRPWLRLVRHSANLGVNQACNTGLGQVTGEFVLFSAADDRLHPMMLERISAAAVQYRETGILFSDPAEMVANGTRQRVFSLFIADSVRHFPPAAVLQLMKRSFFYLSVTNVWFHVGILRELQGFDPRLRWHADLFAAYAAFFLRGGTYIPGGLAFFRVSTGSYSATGVRSTAQNEVLRAWLAKTREPATPGLRSAFREAAILPVYNLRSLRALASDLEFVSARLLHRIASRIVWEAIRPHLSLGMRRFVRRLASWKS